MVRASHVVHGLGNGQGRQTFLFTITAGFVIGFSGSYLFLEHSPDFGDLRITPSWLASGGQEGAEWYQDPHSHVDLDHQQVHGEVGHHGSDEEFHKDEDQVARELEQRVRVLCWVMTNPKNHETKARHVKATWGKRCNILVFMSSVNDTSLPSVDLEVEDTYNLLWGKTKAAFTYVYEHYDGQYDWVLKADDDTYVVVENLRYTLYPYNSSEPLYFGCRFKPYVKQGYMSGGAGYVLSKEAVKRFVTKAIPDNKICKREDTGAEDVEIGSCLEHVGVLAMDSRDQYERGRFFPFNPSSHLFPYQDPGFWYWQYIYYNTTDGLNCCSDSAVTFHYIGPQEMYVMEYLIYHLRPYGIQHSDTLHLPPSVV